MKSPVSIAWDVLKSVVVPIKRQFGYVMSSKSYVQDLQKEVENLRDTAQRVENDVQEARNNLRRVSSQVVDWQGSAEKALKEAEELLDTFYKDSKSCCYGTLPDLNCRYQFSKNAKDKIEDIMELARECREFGNISFGVHAPTASPRIEGGLHTVSDLLRWAVTAIKHVISSESYAEDLRKEVGKLAYEVDWVDLAVEEANKDHREVYKKVSNWHGSADKALKEARNLLGKFKKASKTWCCGTLPDPRCHYEFSTKAKDKVKGIQELTQEISEYKKLDDICSSARPGHAPPPPPGHGPPPRPARKEGEVVFKSTTATAPASSASWLIKRREDGLFESRALMIQKVMDALDNTSNSVVGIYGMGGVGKSTLLNDVIDILIEERSFNWVAKADVSENPDIKRIQGEIAHWLALTDMKKEDNVSARADLLRRRLQFEEVEGNKVLIILDNLWGRLDLDKVGIPCGPDNKVIGCKLLLSSRDSNVLRREMCCDRDFLLGGLLEDEARALFERMVGDDVDKDEFKPMVQKVLDRCAGVPLPIVVMAKRLRHVSLNEWRDALDQIEMGNDEAFNEMINHVFRLSYDHLREEEKSFLQLCVVHGGSEPSLENLKKYGVSLGIFREDGSEEEARDKWRSLIRSLQDASLLLDGGEADRFKMHDLVREFVVSTASRDHRLSVLNDKGKSVTECLGA